LNSLDGIQYQPKGHHLSEAKVSYTTHAIGTALHANFILSAAPVCLPLLLDR
jgi:hypothetical protein